MSMSSLFGVPEPPMHKTDRARFVPMAAEQEQKVVDAAPRSLFIGGEWRDASSGTTFEVEDPSTQEPLCSVADASPLPSASCCLGSL